jgi:hypothetical protein
LGLVNNLRTFFKEKKQNFLDYMGILSGGGVLGEQLRHQVGACC